MHFDAFTTLKTHLVATFFSCVGMFLLICHVKKHFQKTFPTFPGEPPPPLNKALSIAYSQEDGFSGSEKSTCGKHNLVMVVVVVVVMQVSYASILRTSYVFRLYSKIQMCHYASGKQCTVSAPNCTKSRLAAGLRLGQVRELTALPRLGAEGRGGVKRRRGEGKEKKRGKKGEGGRKGKEGEGRSPPY